MRCSRADTWGTEQDMKEYEAPYVEICEIEAEDFIATSEGVPPAPEE